MDRIDDTSADEPPTAKLPAIAQAQTSRKSKKRPQEDTLSSEPKVKRSKSEMTSDEEDEEAEEDEKADEDANKTSEQVSAPSDEKPKTFSELGIIDALAEACTALGYKYPTPIQRESIPLALQGRDLIGLAETGSGKTAAFALPILQALMEKPQSLFGLVLAPTRELAFQISQQFEALGNLISVRSAVSIQNFVNTIVIAQETDSQYRSS